MAVLVGLLGLGLVVIAALFLVSPDHARGLLNLTRRRRWMNAAFLFRIVVGLVLIAAARQTGLPGPIFVLGVISLLSGLLAPLLGYHRLVGWVDWWASRPAGLIRVWALLALGLGFVFLYAAFAGPAVPAGAPPVNRASLG